MAYAYPINNAYLDKNAARNNVFNSRGNLVNGVKLSGPEELRWKKNEDSIYYCLDLSGKYNTSSVLKQYHLVTFFFKNSAGQGQPIIIRAQLPKQISYTIGSEWGNPISFGGGEMGGLTGLISGLAGKSLATAIDSTTIWANTKPLSMKLDIPIFDDTETSSGINFQEVLEIFGRVTLPTLGENGAYSTTPGPTYASALKNRQDGKAGAGSEWLQQATDWANSGARKDKDLDRVTVQIGGMLLMDWVAIKDFTVTYPNTKAQILHSWPTGERKVQLLPQIANLSVTIETVTGLTATTYNKMLNLDVSQKLSESKTTGNKKIPGVDTAKKALEQNKVSVSEAMSAINAGVPIGAGGMSLANGGEWTGSSFIPDNMSPITSSAAAQMSSVNNSWNTNI